MQCQTESILDIKKLVALVSFLLLVGFSINKKEKTERITLAPTTPTVLTEENSLKVTIPFLQKDFTGFKEALAFKESQGKYTVINNLGYLGKYQFGKATLQRFDIYNTKDFLQNPELQERAFLALCKVNKWILRKDIKRFTNKKINGIIITESGILAAAHLSGAGNVKKFLRSYGKQSFSDAFGTSIENYLQKFSGYDVSNIIPDQKATV